MVSNAVPPLRPLDDLEGMHEAMAPARGHMGEPDEFLLEAMREVDALTPACPPIAPQGFRGRVDLSALVPPDATAAEVLPRCNGAGGCGYHHRKGIPCGQALNERRPPPPAPQRPVPSGGRTRLG